MTYEHRKMSTAIEEMSIFDSSGESVCTLRNVNEYLEFKFKCTSDFTLEEWKSFNKAVIKCFKDMKIEPPSS